MEQRVGFFNLIMHESCMHVQYTEDGFYLLSSLSELMRTFIANL